MEYIHLGKWRWVWNIYTWASGGGVWSIYTWASGGGYGVYTPGQVEVHTSVGVSGRTN